MPLPMNTTNTVSHQAAPTGARLSSKAVIVQLSISAWRVGKKNADETRAVNAKHGVKNKARVSVDICDHPALVEIYRLQTAARAEHYRLTLPVADKGLRLLPVARQMEHARVMGDLRSEIDARLREFAAAYPAERAAAPARLNGLYVEGQWPATADEVAAKFGFTLRCLPRRRTCWSASRTRSATSPSASPSPTPSSATRSPRTSPNCSRWSPT
jgi:hypothetical protein